MGRIRHTPKGADNFQPKTLIFRAGADKEIKTPMDLAKAGIIVSPTFVAERWGPEAASQYTEAMTKRNGTYARTAAVFN
jgi:hypothetical protein